MGLTKSTKFQIFNRDGWTCFYCGNRLCRSIKDGTSDAYSREELATWACIDHVVPISAGGTDAHSNLVTSCRLCNARKGKRTLEEYRQKVSRSHNNYGRMADLLQEALSTSSTPFDEQVEIAIGWLAEQLPVVTFYGERDREVAA